jgi:leucyl-tRNA synthetase
VQAGRHHRGRAGNAEKLGFDTGITARHPFTGAELPVFIANFVLMEYGTGA